MIEFIPILYYTPIYYYSLLLVVLLVFFKSNSITITSLKNKQDIKKLGFFMFLFVVFYLGLRPLSWIFGDMYNYYTIFQNYTFGAPLILRKDILFDMFVFYSAQLMNYKVFFLICAFLYVFPLWAACKKWFKEYSFYAFLSLVMSFSFWAYGSNGIRNGIATSLFLYALSREKLVFKIVFIIVALGFHKSVLIPTVALVLSYFYINPKKYFYGWLACIPISLISGSFWENLFASFMADDRANYLTSFKDQYKDSFSNSGFRWDFLAYSAFAVIVAYFFIFKKNFKDPIYNRLVMVYFSTNAFWILVIRASFSNRFAYLSWFMMGIVIFYPFLTKIQMKNQHSVLGIVLLAYFSFTFLMNVILA